MPRIYAPVEGHTMDWGHVDFINGVAVMPAGSNTAYFTSEGYEVDTSKNALTIFDKMTKDDLKAVCDYFGITYLADDTKQEIVRKVETYVSTANITAMTITSAAGTASGDTKITVADNIGDEGNILVYHVADAVVAPLYKDVLPATGWTTFTSGSDITAATGKKITVCEVNAAREVLSIGSATVTAKA